MSRCTLAQTEAQQRALEIDVVASEEPDGAVAGGRRDEDRDDGLIASVERPVPGAAGLERPEIGQGRALRRGLLTRQEWIERRPAAEPPERVGGEVALVERPDDERAQRADVGVDVVRREGLGRSRGERAGGWYVTWGPWRRVQRDVGDPAPAAYGYLPLLDRGGVCRRAMPAVDPRRRAGPPDALPVVR